MNSLERTGARSSGTSGRGSTEPVQLRFGATRRSELALLVAVLALAGLMTVGSLVIWTPSSWPHQVCSWLGVAAALIFAALLGASLFCPQVVTARRVRAVVIALTSAAVLAILFGVLGFFL